MIGRNIVGIEHREVRLAHLEWVVWFGERNPHEVGLVGRLTVDKSERFVDDS